MEMIQQWLLVSIDHCSCIIHFHRVLTFVYLLTCISFNLLLFLLCCGLAGLLRLENNQPDLTSAAAMQQMETSCFGQAARFDHDVAKTGLFHAAKQVRSLGFVLYLPAFWWQHKCFAFYLILAVFLCVYIRLNDDVISTVRPMASFAS